MRRSREVFAHFFDGKKNDFEKNEKNLQDHYIFTSDARANRNVDILRDMAKQYGIKHFYDIQDRSDFKANPDYKGEEFFFELFFFFFFRLGFFFSRPFFDEGGKNSLSSLSPKIQTPYPGVCHVALAQEGHCLPGEVLLGTDSVS